MAANDVGQSELVNMAKSRGTDSFLDNYFNGSRLGINPFPTGNNLLRPRLKDVDGWQAGRPFAGDYVIRQNTKMWANLYSSRGYREMRHKGFVESVGSLTRLTENFEETFEQELPSSFEFEQFLVWLYAFEGFPDEITSWNDLFQDLLHAQLKLDEFQPEYRGRFRLRQPPLEWPQTLAERPTNDQFLAELAPRLVQTLSGQNAVAAEKGSPQDQLPSLPQDDPILNEIESQLAARTSFAFLLAGAPGTGKTRYARQIAQKLTEGDHGRAVFLQFHPAIAYDDFIEGFRPVPTETGSGVKYDLSDRLFLDFARRASNDPDRSYVAIIDELNRGDVARILGEFLTYLEPDYRGKEFTLSYSGKLFAVPENLIIIATANPYDRSVTDLDDALLRRFWVIELEPSALVLREALQTAEVEAGLINRTVRLFEILNLSFPTGFGHTNFLNVRQPEDLVHVWNARAKMGLKRTLFHDPERRESTIAEINQLLTFPDAIDPGASPEAEA